MTEASDHSKLDERAAMLPQKAEGSAPAAAEPNSARRLGAFGVAILSFAAVAGGPYGIEAAVGAAGPLPVIVGCIVLAFAWSATQCLVSAELASMYPCNGGAITWGVKGLGPQAGFVNAMNVIASAACNLPLYPVLFASYMHQLVPSLTDSELWGIKLAVLLLTVCLNSFGLQAVETAATAFTIIVQTPFIIMPIAAAVYGKPFDWGAVATIAPGFESQLSLFVATLCWNAQGWTNIGNLASEVHNPKVSYPVGAAFACIMVMINYVYPVTVCFALAPNVSEWTTGYFANVGENIAPWVGVWATVAAAFSSLNNIQPQMSSMSRALRFTALYRMIPVPLLRRNWSRFNTPLPAILVQALVVGVLMNFGFNVLVTINVLFYNVGLALQFAAFLRMRYTNADVERPYEVPGGKVGAWAVVLVFYSVLALAFYAATVDTPEIMGVLVCMNALFIAGSFAWARWGYSAEGFDLIDETETAGGDASVGETAAAVIVALRQSRAQRKEAREAARKGVVAAPAIGAAAPAIAAASAGSASSGESDESRVSLLSAAAPLPGGDVDSRDLRDDDTEQGRGKDLAVSAEARPAT